MRHAAITLLVVLCSLSAVADDPRPSSMLDVALDREGLLTSRCTDVGGHPVVDADVKLVRGQIVVGWTTSGPDGTFVFREIEPGTYRLQCRDCDRSIRVWSAASAPPVARLPFEVVLGNVAQASSSPVTALPAATEEPEPVLELQFEGGDGQSRTVDASEQDVEKVTPAPEQDVTDVPEPADQSRHIQHAGSTAAADVPFDPFAGTAFDVPSESELQFEVSAQQQLASPEQQPQPRAEQVVEPVPQAVPPDGRVRYIRPNVGPTVGDVVVTSLGIAGITLGIIGIHKYDNRRVRRVVSP